MDKHAGGDSAEGERIGFCRVSEGKKYADDIREARESEI